MSTKRRLALLSSLAATPVFAAPFLAIGDNAELFLTGRASASYNDNVFLAPDDGSAAEDEIFVVTPGLELTFGKNSLLRGTVSVYEDFVSYSDNSQFNEELAHFVFKSVYEGAKLKVDANASFHERYQNSRDALLTNDLVRFDTYAAGAKGELSVSQKSKIGAGFQYDSTDYKTTGFVDRENYTVPLDYYFAIRPKIDLSAGLQYRKTDTDAVNADYEDYFFNVGARGEFTPKLIGTARVGYTLRDPSASGADDSSLFGVDVGLNYIYSPKTQFKLNLGNDFNTSSVGGSQEVASIDLGVTSQLTTDWSARASIGYQQIDYSGFDRTDNYVMGLLGVSYLINQYVSIDATYTYMENDNNLSPVAVSGQFAANTFSIGASFRY